MRIEPSNTWVMDEVKLAVRKAIRILENYEVYEYQVTQYIPKTGGGGGGTFRELHTYIPEIEIRS